MFRAVDCSTIPVLRSKASRPTTAPAIGLATLGILVLVGCVATPEYESPTVRQAVAERSNDPPQKKIAPPNQSADDGVGGPPSWSDQLAADANDDSTKASTHEPTSRSPVATINGRDIARSYMDRQMLKDHGVDALEPLIVLELAIQRCEELGLDVTVFDIQREYDRRLMQILSPMQSGAADPIFDNEEAERLLKGILERRKISKLQYLSAIKRSAYLRAIAYARMTFTDAELQQEFDNISGEQAVVRHIQLPSQADAQKLKVMIADGLDFQQAAVRYSANLRTGPSGGLLKPFNQRSGDIPQPIREAAFGLEVGEVSEPVESGAWWHLVKLEKKVANGETSWAGHRSELEARLREQRAESEIQRLYRSLLQGADVKFNDPVLAEQYANRRAGSVD